MPKALEQDMLGEFIEHNEAVVVLLKYLMLMNFVSFHFKSLPLNLSLKVHQTPEVRHPNINLYSDHPTNTGQ